MENFLLIVVIFELAGLMFLVNRTKDMAQWLLEEKMKEQLTPTHEAEQQK